jgi:peptidoglycan biosynthesis protein MviN/MurJ (putative lipid II flippase)
MGPDYGPVSGPLITILAVTVWLSGGHMVSVSALMGVNKHYGLTFAFVSEAILNLGLSLALIEPLGLMGVAIGTVVPSLAVNLGYLPWYLKRTLGIQPQVFALNAWVRPTLAAAPFALATYFVEQTWAPETLAGFFLQVFALLPLVAAAVYLVGLPSAERARVSTLMQAAFTGLRRREVGS